ncbi:MAG TPA: hypothetical protein VMW69_13950 [Spirochaetia bacterium]|nr:hypothetical protein [Spirochaetia bacterium]
MSFDLDEFLNRNTGLLSSTQWEKYLTSAPRPIWLEDIGLKPEQVLGEGDYKNYLYEKNKIRWNS